MKEKTADQLIYKKKRYWIKIKRRLDNKEKIDKLEEKINLQINY